LKKKNNKTQLIFTFLKDKNGDLFIKTNEGFSSKVNLTLLLSKEDNDDHDDYDETNKLTKQNVDNNDIKRILNSLCNFSSNIVNTQMKLDKLNLVLKQINLLKQIEMDNSEVNYFQFINKWSNQMVFKSPASIDLTIINNSANFANDFSHLFTVHTAIHFKKLNNTNHGFSSNRYQIFSATKPNSKQTISFKLFNNNNNNDLNRNDYYPAQLCVHLVFDLKRLLNLYKSHLSNGDIEMELNNNLNQLSINIYDYQFDCRDYFLMNQNIDGVNSSHNEMDLLSLGLKPTNSMLLYLLYKSYQTSKKSEKININWNNLSIKNVPSFIHENDRLFKGFYF
jgi:hypothetical protein